MADITFLKGLDALALEETMRVALVPSFFYVVGGTEKLSLEMYRALRDLDYEVDLYTAYLSERAWQVLTSGMNGIPRPIVLGEPLINKLFSRALLLRRLLAAPYLGRRIRKLRHRYDLIIETGNSVPIKWADATYVQTFPLAELPTYYINIEHLKLNLRERAYNSLIAWIARTLADKTKPVIANSSWVAEHVKRAYGSQRVYVVHPPVNVEELSTLGGDRGRIVLTVSRIDWGKRVLEISDIAKLVPEAEFYLVGATGPASEPLVRELKRRSEGLRNFHLETDVPRRRILELMSQASVYLHPPHAEPFGITIAEAAAAGLVPVVYRDGGGWTDIASRIDPSLGYANAEEAAHIVRSLLNDSGRLKALSARAREVAKGFSYERFKERLNEVIRELARA
jgi:glycosyltransferase involved in cell wall biosynthesis